MTVRSHVIAIIVAVAMLCGFSAAAQENPQQIESDTHVEDTPAGEPAVAPVEDPQIVQPLAAVPPAASNQPVVGLADLHLHQWAHFMNAGQWMFGESSGVAHEELTECGWHTGNSRGFEGRTRPRQRHGQGIGRNRAGRSITRVVFGAERADDIVEQHPPAGISRDASMPHWLGWPTSDSIAHQQVWHGWLRLAHDGIPFLYFMHNRSLTDIIPSLREFYDPEHYLEYIREAHAQDVGGLNLVVVSLVHSVAGCRQVTPKRALRLDPTLCSDMDAITDQYHAAVEWAADNASWVQIVRTPDEARAAIHEGKLAIVLSIEASDIFGPSRNQSSYFAELEALAETRCELGDSAEEIALFENAIEQGIRRWLNELPLVTTFQIAHQLDNPFSSAGYIKKTLTGFSQGRVGRELECRWRPPRRSSDRGTRPGELDWQDAYDYAACLDQSVLGTRGLISSLFRRPWRHSRREPTRADDIPTNPYGLSIMGRVLVDVMVAERMPIDASHMSDRAQRDLLEYLDAERHDTYPVYVSHTYPMESNALRREQNLDAFLHAGLLQHGGLVGIRPGDDEHIVVPGSGEIEVQGAHASCQGTSIGARMHLAAQGALPVTFGTDLNGFINQTRPSGMIRPDRTVGESPDQDCGEFIVDIGSEIRSRGLAHVGLMPALFLEMLLSAEASEQQRVEQMANGAEAYIQLWERAHTASVTPGQFRAVNTALLREMLFDTGGELRTLDHEILITGGSQLQDDGARSVFGQMSDAPETVLPGAALRMNLELPRLRVIESTLPYGPVTITEKTGIGISWDSYPQLPSSIGLLIGTQSFGRHPVGAQFPVGFCRRFRIDKGESGWQASHAACEQLRETRGLHRIPRFRRAMYPRGRFSGWRREFPNQSRRMGNIDLHLDVIGNWILPAQMPHAQQVYDWLALQPEDERRRILRNRFFENGPVPSLSFVSPEQYVQQTRDRSTGLERFLAEDPAAARRCVNRDGRGGPACQAFVGLRAYCELIAVFAGHSDKAYCEAFLRDLSQ